MTTQAYRVRVSTRCNGHKILQPYWFCELAATTTAILIILPFGALSSTPVLFVCTQSSREMSFAANVSWQEVTVNGTYNNFTGNCAVNVKSTSNSTNVAFAYRKWQYILLLKVHRVQFLPASSGCLFGSCFLLLVNPSQTNVVDRIDMNPTDSSYIWVYERIQLYLYVWPVSETRASFSVAFADVPVTDVCQSATIPSETLIVDNELYVFAPDEVFFNFLRNSTACSGSKQIRLVAARLYNELNVTVLATPTNGSCWMLWIDGIRVGCTGSSSFVIGGNITLLYVLNNSNKICNRSELQRGFTIKASEVSRANLRPSIAVPQQYSCESEIDTGVFEMTTQETNGFIGTTGVAAIAATVSGVIVLALIGGIIRYLRRQQERLQRMLHEENSQTPCERVASENGDYEKAISYNDLHEYSGLDETTTYNRFSSPLAEAPSLAVSSVGTSSKCRREDDENRQIAHLDVDLSVDSVRRPELNGVMEVKDFYEQVYDNVE